jgi:hypothetical protein
VTGPHRSICVPPTSTVLECARTNTGCNNDDGGDARSINQGNIAQATIPASASPPCQCPTTEVAKSIIRLATPPWVRKFPARMKNGTAMISKRSMPVNTVSPREIEIGIPASISAMSKVRIGPERGPAENRLAEFCRQTQRGLCRLQIPADLT